VRDEYCASGPHATWTDVITRADLLRALQSDARTNVGARLDQVTISKRDETGRAQFITLEGEHRKQVRGWDFKIIVGRVLGWNVLKSSRFEVARTGSNFIFHGKGFGHGLGLCQEGAHVMAARGSSYTRILEKYFPGARVLPRSGNLSLARPFKAGNGEVAENTSSNGWKADILGNLPAHNSIVTGASPQSGEMFIDPPSKSNPQLRRSAMFSKTQFDRYLHCAPTELTNSSQSTSYKYFVPTGLRTSPRLITISSEHFRITYPTEVDRRDANLVLNTLESARSDFLHRASAASLSTDVPLLEIRINASTGDFTARTGQPWWAAAATKGNRIELQPAGVLKRRGSLTTTLRHELAHVVIDAVSRNRAPRWLGEGFAIYLAGEGPMLARYATKTKLSSDEIEKRLARPGSQQEMRMLYSLAYNQVFDLIRTGTEASVWKKLEAS
jgi:hypothetical protein